MLTKLDFILTSAGNKNVNDNWTLPKFTTTSYNTTWLNHTEMFTTSTAMEVTLSISLYFCWLIIFLIIWLWLTSVHTQLSSVRFCESDEGSFSCRVKQFGQLDDVSTPCTWNESVKVSIAYVHHSEFQHGNKLYTEHNWNNVHWSGTPGSVARPQ